MSTQSMCKTYADAYGLDLLAWWVKDGQVCITIGEQYAPHAMVTKWITLKRLKALTKKLMKK